MLEKCVLTILELNWSQRLGNKKTKLNICHHMLTSSTHLQNWSIHVVERTRTSAKCQKMKYARAKRAKILFFIAKYANLWGFCCRCRRACLSSLLPTPYLRFYDNASPAPVNLSFPCLCTKAIRAKQGKVHFAYFVQHDQLGLITEHFT